MTVGRRTADVTEHVRRRKVHQSSYRRWTLAGKRPDTLAGHV